MVDEYPKLLYRKGGSEQIWQYLCETRIVKSAAEEAAAAEKGWFTTPAAAYGEEPGAAPKASPVDNNFVAEGESAALKLKVGEMEDQLAAERARADGYESQLADLRASAASDVQMAAELLRTAEQERDEAKAALAAFDRDGDGKAGGSKKRG